MKRKTTTPTFPFTVFTLFAASVVIGALVAEAIFWLAMWYAGV